MNLYTKEQIAELKKLDVIQHFKTVLDSDYKRGTSSIQDNKVADICIEKQVNYIEKPWNL